ncbi:MAG: hypothetical protein AAGF93_13880 [Cyanobacteria bacterium P01_H01_bin.105]
MGIRGGFEILAQLSPDSERVPMMYRAQIDGRCSLHFAGKDNQDLDNWLEQWTHAGAQNQSHYQHQEPKLGWDGSIYRIEVEFPWRLFSDCGQDSIARPVIGKNGIPVIPGSSVKGLFRRVCDEEQLEKYCGGAQGLDPSTVGFRFHGAYPVGNWCDRIADLVHPQQSRQVEHKGDASAYALISLYRPQMVFEFSAAEHTQVDWQEIHELLKAALQQGVGGKTSTGYGMGGHEPGQAPNYPPPVRMVRLAGMGTKSVLRTDIPEFRPNLFKATLRSHTQRLLGGLCANRQVVDTAVRNFFGSSERPGKIQITWDDRSNNDPKIEDYSVSGILKFADNPANRNKSASGTPTKTYNIPGVLRFSGNPTDVEFLFQILQFAYTMGGFGKSWRRVWHKEFYPDYPKLNKFHIGCHWESRDIVVPKSSEELAIFIDDLIQKCQHVIQSANNRPSSWAETWHRDRVAVFSHLTSSSTAIKLFHYKAFKNTIAVGGRKPKPKELSVSSVWHRMLPVSEAKFLEIVTLFHKDTQIWRHEGQNQLSPFIEALEQSGLSLTWGQHPFSR